jgi:hypothetical protein
MMKSFLLALFVLLPQLARAQPAPLVGRTLVTTDVGVTSVCVGGNTPSAPSTCLGGLQAGPTVVNQAITLPSFTPGVTTNKLYNVGGNLFFNGLALATGGSVGPGTATFLPVFTGANSIGNSVISQVGTVITIAGTVNSTVFGANSFTAGGVGDESLTIRNTTAGVANRGVLFLGNDASATLGTLAAHSSTFTTSGAAIANGVKLTASGVGGLSLQASDATGIIHFFTGTGTTERGQITAAGLLSWSTFGTNQFVAGGTGGNIVRVGNTTAGAGNFADLTVASDTVSTDLFSTSSTFTTAGSAVQASSVLTGNGVGGVSLVASQAAGALRIYTGGGALRATVFASGAVSIGNTTDLGASGLSVTGGVVSSIQFTVSGAGAPDPVDITAVDAGVAANRSVHIGRNSNAAPVASSVALENSAGTRRYLWVDATGVVRVGSGGGPAFEGDTGGTIVGTQTSTRDAKILRGETLTPATALAQLLQTPIHEFTYRSGAYNGTVFQGIVADEAPVFMMDAGRSFSPISAFGYTVQAIKALQAEIAALKAAR